MPVANVSKNLIYYWPARLMCQYRFARCLLSSVVVVCNATGVRAGRPPCA